MTNVPLTVHLGLLSHLPPPHFVCYDSVMSQMQTRSSSISLPHSLLSSMPLLCIYLLSSPPSLPLSSSSSSSHCALTSPFPFHTQAASSTSPLLPFTLTSLRSSHLLFLSVTYQHHSSFCCRSPTATSSISPSVPFSPSFFHTRSLSLSRANSALHTLMLIGTQGRSAHSLSRKTASGRFACATARLLDTELS